MKLVRSVLFTQLFIIFTIVQLLFWTPVFFFMKRENGWKVVKVWGYFSLWLQHKLVGTNFDFRGLDNIPKDGGFFVASKHQSSWETYTMVLFLDDPSYILKRELVLLPFFGWFALKMKVIAVNRGKRGQALKAMTAQAKNQIGEGRQIVIYPEGTRKFSYEKPDYRYGITRMYDDIGARVLPVALNSGLFWPRRGWNVYQGTCVLEFLPVIEPGMPADAFSKHMESVIESKVAELNAEAEADPIFIASKS